MREEQVQNIQFSLLIKSKSTLKIHANIKKTHNKNIIKRQVYMMLVRNGF